MDLKERLLKIYALAQQGVGGEKENAEAILQRALAENQLTLDDLLKGQNCKYRRWFKYSNIAEQRLIVQILGKIKNINRVPVLIKPKSKEICAELTHQETVLASMLVDVYLRVFRKEAKKLQKKQKEERKVLVTAFVHKHNIFSNQKQEGRSSTSIDLDIFRDLYDKMENVDIRQQLPGHMLENKK